MPYQRASWGAAILAALCLWAGAPAIARADKAACASAYESAQALKKSGSLRQARAQLEICAAETCPTVVRGDCSEWLGQVETAVPTVTFAVTDEAGKDLTDVRVSFDGAALVEKLDGKAVEVDPGEHTFAFESGNRARIELKVLVHEGEKARVLTASWGASKGAPDSNAPAAGDHPGETAPPAAAEHRASLAAPVVVLASIGVVGMALFGTFGGLGLAERSDAEASCKPKCSDEEVAPIKTKFLVADVSLGVGAAALVTAAVVGIVWATRGPTPKNKTATLPLTFGVAPVRARARRIRSGGRKLLAVVTRSVSGLRFSVCFSVSP